MVLDDITDGACLVVKRAAALHPEALGHRDLHAIDVGPIPDRFEKAVGEPKVQQVLNWLFAQVMVDAKDRGLSEDPSQRSVQLLC